MYTAYYYSFGEPSTGLPHVDNCHTTGALATNHEPPSHSLQFEQQDQEEVSNLDQNTDEFGQEDLLGIAQDIDSDVLYNNLMRSPWYVLRNYRASHF